MIHPIKVTNTFAAIFVLIVGIAAYNDVKAHEPVSVKADISIGSIIGEDDEFETRMPFWGDLYINKRFHSGLNLLGGVGHRSNVDQNGQEYDFEYAFGGFRLNASPFYVKATLGKALRGDQTQGDVLGWAEAGIQQGNLRFGAFHRDTEDNGYSLSGLKLGYTFNLIN